MAVNPLVAAIPTSPMVDADGNVTTAWRAFFASLQTRTGGPVGQATPTDTVTQSALTAETTARTNADTSLNTAVNTKYNISGGTITGNVGFYSHAAGSQPIVTGSKASNAALASLLSGLAALGLVNDAST